jgi:hypothetical protein
MISEISQVPLMIADPLIATIEVGDTSDAMGWFSFGKRIAYVDPATIYSSAGSVTRGRGSEGTDSRNNLFQAQLRKTTYHELIHATNSLVYDYSENDISNGVRGSILWPKFIRESMTEKLAYLAASKKFEQLGSKVDVTISEKALRELVGDDSSELMAPKRVRDMMESLPSSYFSYRLIIDTLIAKLDWESVGLERKDVEKLFIGAVFEQPNHELPAGEQKYPLRKRLNQAIAEVAHPGILNKLGVLVDILGPNVVLDILQSSNFDPHDPSSIPWISSPRRMEVISNAKNKKARTEAILKSQEENGYPKHILSNNRTRLEKLEGDIREFDLLLLAVSGLKAEIWDRYGHRKRKIDSSDRLLRSIFGKIMNEPMLLQGGYSDQHPTEIAALEEYRRTYIKPSSKS